MKKFKFLAGAAALLAVGFASCSDDKVLDEPVNNGPQVAEVDHTMYVNVAISSNTGLGGRAADSDPDYTNGDAQESKVSMVYFVFYDTKGEVVGDIVQVPVANLGTATTPDSETGSIVRSYTSIVPVSILKGQESPTQVMCYVNPLTPAELQNPLNVIETVTRLRVVNGTGENQLFPMSNSVYYASTTAEGPVRATPIGEGQLFESEQDAEDAVAKKPTAARVNIYVERYASKLGVKQAANAVKDYEAGEGEEVFTLTFEPTAWALNQVSKIGYVTKSYRAAAGNGEMLGKNYTYGEANAAINGTLAGVNAWKWNSDGNHRSYWACSPSYYSTKYPEVAGDITDPDEYELQYLTESQALSVDYAHAVTAAGTTDYFRETTTGTLGLTSVNPAATIPSVILVGKYQIKKGETEVDEGTTFYTYQKNAAGNANIYFEATGNNAASAVEGGTSMLRRFINQITILTKRTGAGTETDPYVYTQFDPQNNAADLQYLAGQLKIAKVSSTAGNVANVKVAARRRTVQLNSAPAAGDFTLCYANGANYAEVTAANLATVNQLLMQNVGFADKYNAGSAYFNIPVKHLGWYRTGNANLNATTIDWSKVMIGDFGMVRNHVYDISVNNISGLGTAIADPNDPIVPPAETKDYFVAYQLNILNWAIVPTQDVDLQ